MPSGSEDLLEVDSDADDVDVQSEVLSTLAQGALPYAKDGFTKNELELLFFKEHGVKCLSDAHELQEGDLKEIMATVQLRRWRNTMKTGNAAVSTLSSHVLKLE